MRSILHRKDDQHHKPDYNDESFQFWRIHNQFWSSSLAGMYDFMVFADSTDKIIETSEANNLINQSMLINVNPDINYLHPDSLQGLNVKQHNTAQIADEWWIAIEFHFWQY